MLAAGGPRRPPAGSALWSAAYVVGVGLSVGAGEGVLSVDGEVRGRLLGVRVGTAVGASRAAGVAGAAEDAGGCVSWLIVELSE